MVQILQKFDTKKQTNLRIFFSGQPPPPRPHTTEGGVCPIGPMVKQFFKKTHQILVILQVSTSTSHSDHYAEMKRSFQKKTKRRPEVAWKRGVKKGAKKKTCTTGQQTEIKLGDHCDDEGKYNSICWGGNDPEQKITNKKAKINRRMPILFACFHLDKLAANSAGGRSECTFSV